MPKDKGGRPTLYPNKNGRRIQGIQTAHATRVFEKIRRDLTRQHGFRISDGEVVEWLVRVWEIDQEEKRRRFEAQLAKEKHGQAKS